MSAGERKRGVEEVAEPLLDVRDLTVRFHTLEGIVHAVNGISYTLNYGEMLGIVGESGCGKSVSVLSVMGLIPQPPGEIAAGQVLFHGQDLLKLGEEELRHIRGKDIAMVFQDPMTSFNPVLTIGRQVGEAPHIHLGTSWDRVRKQVADLLALVGIPSAADRLDDYPHQFSGGMRQRAMISMGLSCNPSLLIADEPTTALDVTIQAQIVDLVKGLRHDFDMAVIWITHDLGVVAGLAERVIVMYAGFIVEQGTVDDIYKNPHHPYTKALLQSLPRVDRSSKDRLATIPGFPPDLLGLPPGCPFMPRCTYAVERCRRENPKLIPIALGGANGSRASHQVACWVDVSTGEER
jgi:oligopeptide transport system ATP-binding protein